MRSFLFFIFLGLAAGYANTTFSQTIDLKLEEVSLKTIFEKIEEKTDYIFIYKADILTKTDLITVNFSNTALPVILNTVLKNKGLDYKISERQVIVFKTKTGKSSEPDSASVKNIQSSVSGTVTDAMGMPLPGVNVIEKGTNNGVVTDFNGDYSIQISNSEATLEFSYLGFTTVAIPVEGQEKINVELEEDQTQLDEVVVVGYGQQRKVTLTGAVAEVDSEELTQRPAANSTELLQGQVAGLVTHQPSGLPGSDNTNLSIRGMGNPLVLVDGVPGDLDQIDPNNIESISVLKDASAGIYGARAGNGVILVTTKRGTEKASQINYHGTMSFATPTFEADMVDANRWAEMLQETGLDVRDYSPAHIDYDPEENRLINTIDGSVFEGYNWRDAIYRDWTPQQQHNLNVRGGTDKIRYFVSGGYTDQESNFKSGDYDFSRYNTRANIDAEITESLTISADLAYRSMLLERANVSVFDVYNSTARSKPVYPYVHEADPTRAAYSGFSRNDYQAMFKDYSGFVEERENVLRGRLALKYEFPMIEGLAATAELNYEDVFSWNKTVSKPFEMWEYNPLAAESGEDPWLFQGEQNQNRIWVSSGRFNKLLPILSVEYEKNLGDHYIKGMVVNETWTTEYRTLRADRRDLLSFEAPYLNYASEEEKDNAETFTEQARSSWIGRLNYNYREKYMLEVAMRADASAEYAPSERWGYFPSISAGWRISEEPFIKDNFSAVNNLKLRVSYGILGNDAASSFAYLTGYNVTGGYYIFGASPAPVITSTGLANPDVTWETMKMTNIGLDGTFWNGKLGFVVDAFYRLREDILATPRENIPNTFGSSLPQTNLNKRDNRGFEVALTHENGIGDFSYHISPMFSWTRGKFVDWEEDVLPVTDDMDEETREYNLAWNRRYVNEGQWDNRQWGFVTEGFFMNQQEIDEHPIDQDLNENQTLRVGDLKYRDLNEDGIIDWRDQDVIGYNGLPNIMYSMDMGASFKSISVRMLWQGAANYSVNINGAAAAPFQNESIPLDVHYDHRAIVGTDAEGNEYITNPDNFKLPPATQDGLTTNNSRNSDFWTYNARYLRLKNINISYVLPKKLIDEVGVKQASFYLSGTNLFTISNLGIWKDSFDPEIRGQDNRNYPPVKTVTLGLRLSI